MSRCSIFFWKSKLLYNICSSIYVSYERNYLKSFVICNVMVSSYLWFSCWNVYGLDEDMDAIAIYQPKIVSMDFCANMISGYQEDLNLGQVQTLLDHDW